MPGMIESTLPMLIFLLALMAGLAAVETWMPLRQQSREAPRVRSNLALTAFFFGVNVPLTAVVLGL